MMIAAIAAAVRANSALRLISGGVAFSGAGTVAPLSVGIRVVGAGLLKGDGLGVFATGGDPGVVKATDLATGDIGCATAGIGPLLTGLLLRPTV
jgi:hypothetical protein